MNFITGVVSTALAAVGCTGTGAASGPAASVAQSVIAPPPEVVEGVEATIVALTSLPREEQQREDVAFQLAAARITHTDLRLVAEGVATMERLCEESTLRLSTETSEERDKRQKEEARTRTYPVQEYLFFAAVGYTKLGELETAQACLERRRRLAEREWAVVGKGGESTQTLALARYVEEQLVLRERVRVVANVGTAAAVTIGAMALLRSKR